MKVVTFRTFTLHHTMSMTNGKIWC